MGFVTNSTTPNSARFRPGVEFTVKGRGRYRVVRLRLNGEVNAWGPIDTNGNTPKAGMHTFRQNEVTRIHYKVRAR